MAGALSGVRVKASGRKRGGRGRGRGPGRLQSPVYYVLNRISAKGAGLLSGVQRAGIRRKRTKKVARRVNTACFPITAVRSGATRLQGRRNFGFRIPKLLIVSAPNRRSFAGLHSQNDSLYGVTVLIISVVRNLRPRALRSLNLLQRHGAPFVITLGGMSQLCG